MKQTARQADFYQGSRWLRMAIWLCVLLLLFYGLLLALRESSEYSERQAVTMSVGNLENALQLAFDRAQIQQKSADWVGKNPFLHFASPPSAYQGECTAPPPGAWCFDPASGELRYRPQAASLGAGCDYLAWRIIRDQRMAVGASFLLQLVPVGACRWAAP